VLHDVIDETEHPAQGLLLKVRNLIALYSRMLECSAHMFGAMLSTFSAASFTTSLLVMLSSLSLGLGLAVFRLNGWRLLQHVKFTAHDGGKKALAEPQLLTSLRLVFENARVFGSHVWSNAVNILSSFIGSPSVSGSVSRSSGSTAGGFSST
jgi:hypothetical protein